MKKISAFVVLIFNFSFAQTSELMKGCSREGNASHLIVTPTGELSCDDKGPILWVRESEEPKDAQPLVQTLTPDEDGTLSSVSAKLGKLSVPSPITIDAKKFADIDEFEDDVKTTGSDLWVEKMIIEKGNRVYRYNSGQPTWVEYIDPETGMSKQDPQGNWTKVNASEWAFLPFALIDVEQAYEFEDPAMGWDLDKISSNEFKNKSGQVVASQVILPGIYVCRKPKRGPGSRTRPYVSLREKSHYCFGDTRGINLPPGIKNGTSEEIAAELVFPYSQKSAEGREDDNMALWRFSTAELAQASHVLLTAGENELAGFSRVIVWLTKKPVYLE